LLIKIKRKGRYPSNPAASKPHGGISLYRELLANVLGEEVKPLPTIKKENCIQRDGAKSWV